MAGLIPSSSYPVMALAQPVQQQNVPISQTDWGQLMLIGNDIALQWYSALADKPAPVPQQVALPGGGVIPTAIVQQQGTIFLVLLFGIGALLLLRR